MGYDWEEEREEGDDVVGYRPGDTGHTGIAAPSQHPLVHPIARRPHCRGYRSQASLKGITYVTIHLLR